jgi:Tol biopolymer transport system component
MRLAAGSTLGPYQVSGPIGAGGMGEVYRARDTRLGREVAIKVLPQEVSADPQRLARFEREARSASALNHPNIVTIHDFASRDGETWLVMELVRGQPLRELLEKGPLALKKLLPIAAGIADGLAAAHAAGIVHRDLKPENVMVTSEGVPKILDFGLVKFESGSQPAAGGHNEVSTEFKLLTREGTTLGTAAYMSPEQACGCPVDFRSDQFSLGLILYEMAKGRHPFRRSTPFETLTAIVNDDSPSLDDSFPERFVQIVERCLAKNPLERYGSTIDLAHDLRSVVLAAPARRATRVSARRQTVFTVLAAFVAATAIVMLVMRKPAQTAAPMQVAVATPQIAQVAFGEVSLPVTISPDGRSLAIRGTGIDGGVRIWLHDLRFGTTRPIAGTEQAVSMTWSPDSRSIAFIADGKLKTTGIDGGPPRVICDALTEGTPAWRGDTILFFQYAAAPGIYRAHVAGGTAELVFRSSAPVHSPMFPEFLPDGKHLLYLALTQTEDEIRHELLVRPLDGGPSRSLGAIDSRAIFSNGHLVFVRDGVLLAQPFDLKELRFRGEPTALIEGLHYFRSTGLSAFSISENGLLAWRPARRPSRQVWLDRSGVEAGSLGTAVFDGGQLSPDGRRYAAGLIDPGQGMADVWIYDLDRGHSERVTFRMLDEKFPVWSPDGQTIYYRSDGGGGPPDVFRWNPAEGRGIPLYRGPAVEQPQDVSPDGKSMLIVEYHRAAGSDVLVLPLDPLGPPRPFTRTPFNEFSPRFSPDGRWVAYVSDMSGDPEIYVRRFVRPEIYLRRSEGSATAARISKDGGTQPRWSRDGRELFYLGRDGRLMALPVRFSGAQFEPGTPRMLFQAAGMSDFEVAPDGTRFLVQLEELSSPPAVQLLINWPARLTP